jgi:hypothetical protein
MWDVVVTGIVNTENQDEAIQRASMRLKLSPAKIRKILNSTPKVVKSGLDQSTAEKYVYSLKKIGLLAEARQQIEHNKEDTQQEDSHTRLSFRKNNLALAAGFLIASVIGIWIYDRLVTFEASLQPAHVFESEFNKLSLDSITACSNQGKSELEWDITDYSYNVIENPKDKIFRYKNNLASNTGSELHIIGIGHGTGRISVHETSKPVILYLMSAGYSRWFIELGGNSNIEKIVVHPNITEINISHVEHTSLWDNIGYLLGEKITPLSATPIYQVSEYPKCGNFFPGFQTGNPLKIAKERSLYLENVLGQREESLQVTYGQSSYYDQTFQVPLHKYKVSDKKHEQVYRPDIALRNRYMQPTQQESLDENLVKLRKMRRNPSITADNSIRTVNQLLDIIKRYQEKKLLPTHIPPSRIFGKKDALKWFEIQSFRHARTQTFQSSVKGIDCNSPEIFPGNILAIVGDSRSNKVKCGSGNEVYVMAEGKDNVDDAWGDDLIDAGPGNDVIDAGWGRDILYFGYGWGEDVVDKTCTGANVFLKDTPSSSRYFWDKNWKYYNFIVFGSGIDREDIVDLGNKLVNRKTGDSINFKSRCFNLIFDE